MRLDAQTDSPAGPDGAAHGRRHFHGGQPAAAQRHARARTRPGLHRAPPLPGGVALGDPTPRFVADSRQKAMAAIDATAWDPMNKALLRVARLSLGRPYKAFSLDQGREGTAAARLHPLRLLPVRGAAAGPGEQPGGGDPERGCRALRRSRAKAALRERRGGLLPAAALLHALGRSGRAQRLRGEPQPLPAGRRQPRAEARFHVDPHRQLQADEAGAQPAVHQRSWRRI